MTKQKKEHLKGDSSRCSVRGATPFDTLPLSFIALLSLLYDFSPNSNSRFLF
jgi:hypothetical protein